MGEMFIIPQGFSLGSMGLFAEMPAAGFLAVQGVRDQKLGEFHEIRHTAGPF